MADSELESLFKMIEGLIAKVKGTAGVTDDEIGQIEEIIARYRTQMAGGQLETLTKMREDLYTLYNEHQNRVKSLEKYTPNWEKERKVRDMYFKFLNVPILFLIGMRDETFAVNKNGNNFNNDKSN